MARSTEVTEGVQIPDVWYDDWILKNVGDLSAKVVIMTGANSGTGFWCTNALAGKGATVVMACRTVSKGEAAKQEILGRFPKAKLEVMRLDAMDLASVASFAKDFNSRYSRLDLLVNNAGIMAQPRLDSKDGYDVQFQTNHLAHFLLTALLWPKLLASAAGGHQVRVVNHSSSMHWMGGMKFDKNRMDNPPSSCIWSPMWCIMPYLTHFERLPFRRYGMSKLCNVLFGNELQRRIEAAGLQGKVASIMCHPGYASTQLQVQAAGSMKDWKSANEKSAQSAADGSLPLLMCCVDPSLKGGEYISPSQSGEFKGPPKLSKTAGHSKNKGMARDLWGYSEECCKVTFNVAQGQ